MKKVTVITGGAGGMGIACARIKGKTDRLLLVDVSQEKLDDAVQLLKKEGIEDVETAVYDISDRNEVRKLAKQAQDMGQIETVLNLAGVSPATAEAELILKVNAVGMYNMVEEFFAILGEGSNMVTVNSLSTFSFIDNGVTDEMKAILDDPEAPGFYDALLGIATSQAEAAGIPAKFKAYPLSKYFNYRYSRRNVLRFYSKGIRINTVTPGSISTPMGLAAGDGAQRVRSAMAIDRDGTPDEMAYGICFLTMPEASDITGIDLPVDGGWTCLHSISQIEP